MDAIEIEVLEDGKISVKTSSISEKNHFSADELLDGIEELLGGERHREKREHEFFENKRRQVLRGGKIVTV